MAGGIHRDDNKKARLENNHFSKNRCQLEKALSASGMRFMNVPHFIRERARKSEETPSHTTHLRKTVAGLSGVSSATPGREKVIRMYDCTWCVLS
jgi:hypothetical protein